MKKIICVIIFLISILAKTFNAQNSKTIDWSADLDYLVKELSEKHYDFFTVRSKEELIAGVNKIKVEAKNLSNMAIGINLQQLVAGFGDSHTMVNYFQYLDKSKLLPLQLYWFSDGLYILKIAQKDSVIIGNQILSVNKIPIKTVVDSLSTLITLDNQALAKSFVPKVFPSIQILKYFGFVKDDNKTIEIEVKNLEGKITKHEIIPSLITHDNLVAVKPFAVAFCFKNQKIFWADKYFSEDKIYLVQYNKCWSRELQIKTGNKKGASNLPSFKDLEKKIFKTFNEEVVNKFIFDLRFNGGGSSLQGTQLIEKIADYAKENPDMKIYVLVGRKTFSSAILNAMDFKKIPNTLFVGEETGGKPNHFGEVRSLRLPSSGIRVSYSTKYFKRTDEDVKTIKPCFKIEMSYKDFINGIDPAYEWVKNQ